MVSSRWDVPEKDFGRLPQEEFLYGRRAQRDWRWSLLGESLELEGCDVEGTVLSGGGESSTGSVSDDFCSERLMVARSPSCRGDRVTFYRTSEG